MVLQNERLVKSNNINLILQLKFNQFEKYYETNINNMIMCLWLSTNSYNTLNKYAKK
jgi:hypothetical protein